MIFKIPIIALLVLFQPSLADRGSSKVKISETLMVSGIPLNPGAYEVAWERAGLYADIKFSKGRDVVAKVRGRLFGRIERAISTWPPFPVGTVK